MFPKYFPTSSLSESSQLSAQNLKVSVRKKCLYSELFWSDFPVFGLKTESVRMRENASRITPNTDTFCTLYQTIIDTRGSLEINYKIEKNDASCFSWNENRYLVMWDFVRDFADIFAKSSFLSYLHVSDAIIISKVHGKGGSSPNFTANIKRI